MTPELLEHIESYLQDNLSELERDAFEQELKSNAALRQEVDDQRVILLAIQESSLRTSMDQMHEKLEAQNNGVTRLPDRRWIKYSIAASIAVLVGFVGIMLSRKQNPNDQLFAAHFTPDPGLPTTMSASNNYEFFNAMVSYKQGDYQKAIGVWETLLKEKPSNDTLNYFIGVAHLANDNEEEAISFLQWAAQHPESAFYKEVYHYLGLAHLKNGDKENALVTLKKSQLQKSEDLLKELLSEK